MEPLVDLERRRQAWSSYWAAGGLHSCIGSLVDDREGAIGRFWSACFATLHPGDRVLDLATGNGALPKLLLESTAHPVRVDAVDLAEPRPPWYSADSHPSVTFHPHVGMESLPFPAGAFDLVTSQFGLEYARWPAALDEACRVCGEQGRVAFVLHHADSVVLRMGRVEQEHQQFLLAQGGVLDAANGLLPHLVRVMAGAKPDGAANRARGRYNEAMQRIAERIAASDAPDLLVEARHQVHSILGGQFGAEPPVRHAQLQAYARALADASVRTDELLACALDEAQAGELVEALRARLPGREVESRPLVQDGGIVAWGVRAG